MQAPTVEVARHATLLDNLWNDEYVDGWQAMAQWSRDHVPFPGAAARQIIDLFVRQNALMSGRVQLGGREVRLARRPRRRPQRVRGAGTTSSRMAAAEPELGPRRAIPAGATSSGSAGAT